MRTLPIVVTVCFLALSCSDFGISPEDREFNIQMHYGIRGINEVNTFQNSYTKDLILDGTITVPFVLSQAELNSIRDKVLEIAFFDYPDLFFIQSSDSIWGGIYPFMTYRIKVKLHSTYKTVFWEERYFATDPRADKLKELINLVRNIVETKPEFHRLPPPRGGYL